MTDRNHSPPKAAPGWSRIEIGGKSADIFEPRTPSPQNFAVLFLHGHGLNTLRDNPVFTAEFERCGLRCVCPLGQRSWWGDRVCREFDAEVTPIQFLRELVVPWMADRWGTRPPGIGLLGVSMGGQGVLKLAFGYPKDFPVVAALAPTVDFYLWYGLGLPLDEIYPDQEAARQDTVTLWLHPLNWPRQMFLACDPDDDWFDSVDRLASKLSSSGIPYERELSIRRGGHSWDYFNHLAPRVVGFIAERLDQEGRRYTG